MKSFIATLGICLLLSVVAARTSAQEKTENEKRPGIKVGEIVSAKATIQDIDREKREVTLKKEDGSTATIKVPETVRNFEQIKEGDVVTIRYSESIALAVRKSDEPPSATGRESVERADQGQKPAIKKTATVQITAKVDKIDRDKRELSLKGPEGNTRKVKVPEDVKKFDELKEGDQVVVTATQSLALEVTKPNE